MESSSTHAVRDARAHWATGPAYAPAATGASSGTGPAAAYGDDRPLPHTVAQVELDEGPRLVALLNADAGALQPGAALRLQLDPQGHLVAHRAEPSADH